MALSGYLGLNTNSGIIKPRSSVGYFFLAIFLDTNMQNKKLIQEAL
jgi:hypothetical protein